jgi:hypothetical protein
MPCGVSLPYLRNHTQITSVDCEAAKMPSAAATGNKNSPQTGMRILEMVPGAYLHAGDDIGLCSYLLTQD